MVNYDQELIKQLTLLKAIGNVSGQNKKLNALKSLMIEDIEKRAKRIPDRVFIANLLKV